MKKYIPSFQAKSIYDIDLDFFKNNGFRYLFLDLDNTLDGPHTTVPSLRAIELINKMKEIGLIPIILSNNKKKRVYRYAEPLNIEFIYRAFKPFPFAIKKYIKSRKIDVDSSIIIGDQIMTDIFCANNAHIKSLLTERLTKKDQIITFINRKIDEHFRKKILKNKLAFDWREYYAKHQ